MRDKKLWAALAGLTVLAMFAVWAPPAGAQTTRPNEAKSGLLGTPAEAKENPPMYSYIAVWNIDRAQWGAREKQSAAARKVLDRGMADGTIVAYGFDENPLHDTFWLAMSRAKLQSMLDQFRKTGIAAAPEPAGAMAPPVSILVSRYYNWHSGSWENAYVHVGIYKLKPDAPSDAVDTLSKNFFAPPLEKMLADGSIFEWETDTYADPKDAPGTFLIAYLSATTEGMEKASRAVQETLKSRPLQGPAFDSLVDVGASRDVVVRSYAAYK
jgi:hypothetical protein